MQRMTKIPQNPWLLWPLRFFLGGLFLYAGTQKVSDPYTFADNVAAFKLLPKFLISPMALTLPVLEIVVALMLIVGPGRRAAAMAILFMNAIFMVALGTALARGLDIDCGCFGAGSAKGPVAIITAIIRNLVLAGIAFLLWMREILIVDPGNAKSEEVDLGSAVVSSP